MALTIDDHFTVLVLVISWLGHSGRTSPSTAVLSVALTVSFQGHKNLLDLFFGGHLVNNRLFILQEAQKAIANRAVCKGNFQHLEKR